MILSGTNSYSGGTIVSDGTLTVVSDAALADGTSLTVGTGGMFGSDSLAASPAATAVPEPGTLVLLAAAALLARFLHRPGSAADPPPRLHLAPRQGAGRADRDRHAEIEGRPELRLHAGGKLAFVARVRRRFDAVRGQVALGGCPPRATWPLATA